MPQPIENLLQAFYQSKYSEVIALIKTEPELVNGVDEEFGSSLLQLALEGSKPGDATQELITFIVTHPKFNIAYKKPGDETNLASIISSARADVLSLVIKDSKTAIEPKSLLNEGQLTYVLAKNKLAIAEGVLKRDMQKDPKSKSSERSTTKVANLKEMVSMLRDATILRALATDNADLLTLLDKVGAAPTSLLGKLGGEKLPSMLVRKENTNIRAWYKTRSDKSMEVLAKSSLSMLAAGKAVKDAVEGKESLEKNYLAKRAEVLRKAVENTAERADAVVAACN